MEECSADSADDEVDSATECAEDGEEGDETEEDDEEDPDDGVDDGLLVVGDDPSDEEDQETEDDATDLKADDCRQSGCEDVSSECSELGTGSFRESEADDSAVGLGEDCKSSKDHDDGSKDGSESDDAESVVDHRKNCENDIEDTEDQNHESKILGVVEELHSIFYNFDSI